LELPFPLAGPLPPWRSVFAWIGLVPLLIVLLSPRFSGSPRPLRRGFFLGYLAGFLWYMGNCYWVRDTMMRYGDMPPMAPTLLLIGFSLVLGLYWGLFGLGLALVRRATGSVRLALIFAPFLWTTLELAAARITSVPWDQLGYSQVDNSFLTLLAPWTGVYGVSFVLVAVNALLAGGLLLGREIGNPLLKRFHSFRDLLSTVKGGIFLRRMPLCIEASGNSYCGTAMGRRAWASCGAVLLIAGFAGVFAAPSKPSTIATAVLIQPNLDVGNDTTWGSAGWDRHVAEFAQQAGITCRSFIEGIPQTGAPVVMPQCPVPQQRPNLVAWPESPAPFIQTDRRFNQAMAEVASAAQAPLIIGGIGDDYGQAGQDWRYYNSAMVFGPSGKGIGRYDKIHLVPFGEYIPFQNLLTFAHKLTGRVSSFSRGSDRKVFFLDASDGEVHRYGVFICYEAVFADEVRHFAKNGAQVLVNISDDGWYGDTSAPWQHLNMARMRAVENRRWILRDTNNGITAAIDPYGTVRQSILRHQAGALAAQFGYRDDITFYTAHGDVFAWLCAMASLALLASLVVRGRKERIVSSG
jgi:apolipoprotein N-acyltransferase